MPLWWTALSGTVRWIILGLIAALLLAGLLWLNSCQRDRSADTQADLQKSQSEAAVESGKDAVGVVTNAAERETEVRDTVAQGKEEIAKATPGDSNAAAERATCRLKSYRATPRCVALLGPVPK